MADASASSAMSLSKLDILVAQLESIVASATSKPPDPLMCFDMLSDLLSTLQDQPKEIIVRCQRKCEDALQALLVIGVRPPVRRLCAKALIHVITNGENISIYSRTSSLQGLLLENKKLDAAGYIGLANCLGALYRSFGQKLTAGLSETSNIVVKLIKFPEVFVRQAALQLLQDALEGSTGGGSHQGYSEALRVVVRIGAVDKSPVVRSTAASCLRAVALAGGPGIGVGGLENCCALCVKALEDPSQLVRYSFAEALGGLLALGLNPEAQVQPKGKVQSVSAKTIEGGIQKHLIVPFMRATGPANRELRVGLAMAWVSFLQGMRLTYGHSDLELQNYALQAMGMLSFNSKSQIDAHCQACVLYVLRVGVVEQMSEPAQKEFLTLMTKQLSMADTSASMLVVMLRTISHLLSVLGEVPSSAREALENSLVMALSNSTAAVRVETALTIRALTEVDPFCANNLMSFGVTTIHAIRETVAIEKGDRLKQELDALHGQSLMLGAVLAASPKLILGLPSRLPAAVLGVAKRLILENERITASAGPQKEAGWLLIASVVSSMRKEEMEDQEFDMIALWTSPFGGNPEARLKNAEPNLASEVRAWSAAIEALTAFVKSYVVPNISTQKEGILLQPVLGYLNGALAYLCSTKLQQASGDLKQAVDTFMMRTLMAYRALPDSFCYKSDHNTLLGVCSAPFRDASLWGESSFLRQLLDPRDSSLGPWIPGRDWFEDELRAFEGGSDGPLPCVWDNEVPVFSQPHSVATLLLNELLLCFGAVFVAQKESRKLQLLDIIEGSAKQSRKQSFQGANMTNICVALLSALKETVRVRGCEYEPEVFRRLQANFQGIMTDEFSTTTQRRAAAEGLGILARLGNDVFAARLTRSLLMDTTGVSDINLKGCIAFALGCIHRSKGGMALSVLVPATVQTLCAMSKDPNPSVHIWSLHGLWLTIEAAGLIFVPHVQATMSLVMEILLSEEHAGPELRQSLGRLINAIVAVVGPELSPGSSFFSRCKAVVGDISSAEEPAALLESVLFTQQLVLFAPQAVSFHRHVQTLTPTLWSKQPSLRQAAVSTLRHLAERDPMSMIDERIEQKLFAMLDTETDAGIIKLVRLTLLCLLEAACPLYSTRWLHLCRNVVLATSSTIAAGTKESTINKVDTSNKDIAFGDDAEGMIEKSGEARKNTVEGKSKEAEQLPRYSTRLFAAECLGRLPLAVGDDPRHFNLIIAREDNQPGSDYLVNQLGQLVALAYQVATGVFERLRQQGVVLLITIIEKFGEAEDPDCSGHLLLEQYQAQFVSAVRTALDMNAGPLLLDAGLKLSAQIISSGISAGDIGVIRRVLTLMSHLLGSFHDLHFPSYSEWVGCKVQISLLGAFAAIKSYMYSCLSEGSLENNEAVILSGLLTNELSRLRHLWISLLRDVAALRVFVASQLQTNYKPFLDGILLPAVTVIVRPYLDEVWPVVLEAVSSDLISDSQDGTPSKSDSFYKLSDDEFYQLWALCFYFLCQRNKKHVSKSFHSIQMKGIISDSFHAIALFGIQFLCVNGLKGTQLLTSQMCQDLFKVLLHFDTRSQSPEWQLGVQILKQVVISSPDCFFENFDWVVVVTELSIYNTHQVLSSIMTEGQNVDPIGSIVFETLEVIARRSVIQHKNKLFVVILLLGLRFLETAPVKSNSLSSAAKLLSGTISLIATLDGDQAVSLISSFLVSFEERFTSLLKGIPVKEESEKESTEIASRVTVFLGLLFALARFILDAENANLCEETVQVQMKKLIIEQCIKTTMAALTASQTEMQLAALQTLRTVAQTGISENKQGHGYELSLILMRELGGAVVNVVYSLIKIPLTAKTASSVGESLKLLILLHSLVKGDQAQMEVLHILLPAVIAAAAVESEDKQVAGGLRSVALKLVTHLASQPDCAVQFRSVLLELPTDMRQKLQEILRASMSQPSITNSTPYSIPATAPKLVFPMAVKSSLQPVTKSTSEKLLHAPVSSTVEAKQETFEEEEDDDDDDWDDFQSQTVIEPSISVPDVHVNENAEQESNIAYNTQEINSVTEDEQFDAFENCLPDNSTEVPVNDTKLVEDTSELTTDENSQEGDTRESSNEAEEQLEQVEFTNGIKEKDGPRETSAQLNGRQLEIEMENSGTLETSSSERKTEDSIEAKDLGLEVSTETRDPGEENASEATAETKDPFEGETSLSNVLVEEKPSIET